MDTIRGFWAGASAVARRMDLDELARGFGGWAGLARASVDDLLTAGVPLDVAQGWLNTPPLHTRGRAITRGCADYPAALKTIPGPPPVLFVEGDVEALARPAVAIVGTRACSPYGASVAQRLAIASVTAGFTVVSGLARGIDSHAHRATLGVNGRTIAVLGHGLDHTSPPANRSLRDEIVAHGGLVLSTWSDPVPPARWTFPERNRWIAALARKLVVVEAPDKSGALITASRMLDLGRERDLYVVPGPLDAQSWRGSARLLAMGVQPLCSAQALVGDVTGKSPEERHPDWLTAILHGASIDDAASIRGCSAVELLRELVLLELSGEVVRLPGGRYAPAGGLP